MRSSPEVKKSKYLAIPVGGSSEKIHAHVGAPSRGVKVKPI